MIAESHSAQVVVWMTVESWEEEDVFFPSRCKPFLSSWYLHHFWGPPGLLVYGKWGPFCYKDWHMKLTTDVYLLRSLRVHHHFPMWHNCYGKDHRDSFAFALCLGVSSLFCPLLCFLFHVYSLFITLFCVLHLPLIGLSTLAIEVASSSLYAHKWPTSLNMHSVCWLLYIFLHFTEHLIFGPRQPFFWRLQFWSCGRNIFSMCKLSTVALCICLFHYLVSFLADSLLPSCKKGPDIHSFGKWFKNRRTDKLWKTADDSQGSPHTYQHVLITVRSVDHVRPW